MAEAENFEEDLFADLYVQSILQLCCFHYYLAVAHLSTRRKTSSWYIALRYTEDDNAANPAEAVPEPIAQPSAPATELKAEVKPEQDIEQNPQDGDGDGDQQMYNGEQDMDDEIDFNLGSGNDNGNGTGYDAPSTRDEAQGPGIKEDG